MMNQSDRHAGVCMHYRMYGFDRRAFQILECEGKRQASESRRALNECEPGLWMLVANVVIACAATRRNLVGEV
jgi:hypothetical protein